MKVNLSERPEIVDMKSRIFMYVEERGAFHETTPRTWDSFWKTAGPLMPLLKMDLAAGCSRIDKTKDEDDDSRYLYQAGVLLNAPADNIPHPLQIRETAPGKFAMFVLKGSYSQFMQAYVQAFEILKRENLEMRDEFCIEKYINSPLNTKEEDLETHIYFPVK